MNKPERGVDLVGAAADVARGDRALDGFSGGADEGGARHFSISVGIGGDGRGGAAVVEAPRPRHVARGRVVPAARVLVGRERDAGAIFGLARSARGCWKAPQTCSAIAATA